MGLKKLKRTDILGMNEPSEAPKFKESNKPIQVAISEIIVPEGEEVRGDQEALRTLADSIQELGQLMPVIINTDGSIVAGRRRLAAHGLLGKNKIMAVVRDCTPEEAELIEIDENFARQELTVLERSQQMARRRELYEKSFSRGTGKRVAGFAEEAAAAIGVDKRTVQRLAKIGRDLDPEVIEMLKGNPIEKSTTRLMEIARLPREAQAAAAQIILEEAALSSHSIKPDPEIETIPLSDTGTKSETLSDTEDIYSDLSDTEELSELDETNFDLEIFPSSSDSKEPEESVSEGFEMEIKLEDESHVATVSDIDDSGTENEWEGDGGWGDIAEATASFIGIEPEEMENEEEEIENTNPIHPIKENEKTSKEEILVVLKEEPVLLDELTPTFGTAEIIVASPFWPAVGEDSITKSGSYISRDAVLYTVVPTTEVSRVSNMLNKIGFKMDSVAGAWAPIITSEGQGFEFIQPVGLLILFTRGEGVEEESPIIMEFEAGFGKAFSPAVIIHSLIRALEGVYPNRSIANLLEIFEEL